jgi:hypothetical protein
MWSVNVFPKVIQLNSFHCSDRPKPIPKPKISDHYSIALPNKALSNFETTNVWRKIKQWPLAPNLREWQITRANVTRRVTFFSKMAFGEYRRVWRVLGKWFGECWRVWRVRATRLGESRRVWRVRATPLGECRRVWRVSHISENGRFGEYSNSLNSPASSHCLRKIQVLVMLYFSLFQDSANDFKQLKK